MPDVKDMVGIPVTLRGLRIGDVTDAKIDGNSVVMTMKVDDAFFFDQLKRHLTTGDGVVTVEGRVYADDVIPLDGQPSMRVRSIHPERVVIPTASETLRLRNVVPDDE